MSLVYYRKEREEFPLANAIKLTDDIATLYFHKLKLNYKFQQTLKFWGYNGGGLCNATRIRLSHNPSILVLAHEVAHAIQFRKRNYTGLKGKHWHTKEHRLWTKKVLHHIDKYQSTWMNTTKVVSVNA